MSTTELTTTDFILSQALKGLNATEYFQGKSSTDFESRRKTIEEQNFIILLNKLI